MKTNQFRISIAIEDKKTGEMVLLVVNDAQTSNGIALEDDDSVTQVSADDPDDLPRGLEGSLTCSKAEWLTIKNEAARQGVVWSQGLTKTKTPNTFWSAKPKVVVIHVDHQGILDDSDPLLTLKERNGVQRLWGTVEGRISRVVVRDPRTSQMTVSPELQALLDDDQNNT